MKTKGILLTLALVSAGVITALAQGQPPDPKRTPGVQAGADPNRAAFIMANCKVPPAPPAARGGGAPGGAPGARAGGAPPAAPVTDLNVTSTAIPGIIAAGQKWKLVWEDKGNNADGPVGMDDGSLWLAQNDKSTVVRIDKDGNASVIYTDTFTGGSLAANNKGQIFIAERALNPAIWLLAPQRRLFTNTYKGEPFDCIGAGVLNDMTADSKGGVYFTMGGVYYANPQGVVSGRFGTVGGNGIILSPDEKTLYVTGRLMNATPPAGVTGNGGLVAFDVQADGSLTNERQFAWYGGDGTAVDKEGRIYTTANGPGVAVISPRGELIGNIPVPRNLISVAFGGTDKKTLYGVSIRDVQIFSIPVLTEGLKGRPK
ncbi:MAG: SMP-30/gluconolactonase/LRE family protein [Vicinamibacterales bacterium]